MHIVAHGWKEQAVGEPGQAKRRCRSERQHHRTRTRASHRAQPIISGSPEIELNGTM
jgi:hypothetical protein